MRARPRSGSHAALNHRQKLALLTSDVSTRSPCISRAEISVYAKRNEQSFSGGRLAGEETFVTDRWYQRLGERCFERWEGEREKKRGEERWNCFALADDYRGNEYPCDKRDGLSKWEELYEALFCGFCAQLSTNCGRDEHECRQLGGLEIWKLRRTTRERGLGGIMFKKYAKVMVIVWKWKVRILRQRDLYFTFEI